MNDVADPRAWTDGAEEDYLLARSALRRKRPLTKGACFHAQQCAEKSLKAILVAQGRPFPKTHDLKLLSDLCAQAGVFLGINPDELSVLSDHAVRTRYPRHEPTPDDARQALDTARAVRRFVRRMLGVR